MIVVIIAGGSGTRLWPLSTATYPKHLLRLTNPSSLLQNTFNRVKPLTDNIFVVSEASHIDHVYEQLSELPKDNILVEPARRGTASCIIMALAEIKKRALVDQAILFLWADHLIRDDEGFRGSVEVAAQLAEEKQELVFMGIEPTYPSTGFGYMHKGNRLTNGMKNVFELERFVEKPDKHTAEEYFQSGQYLWNTGYLTGTLSAFEESMQAVAPDMWSNYQSVLKADDLKEAYLALPNEAIDYTLSQKLERALVVPGTFDWVDVGSFQDLYTVSTKDDQGNHTNGQHVVIDSSTNSFIRNDSDLPVAVIGLDNVAVIVNEHGILVTNQTHAQKVGDVAKKLQAQGSLTSR